MNFSKKITRAQIANYVNEFAYETFGSDFRFREGAGDFPGQFDVCVDTIFEFVTSDNDDTKLRRIIQAPTGSGKSKIAMIIAGVLVKQFNMRGYILVSDRALLDQYVTDVEMSCPTWGTIKGKSAYMCVLNGRKYDHGVCKIKNADAAIYSLDTPCECPLRHVCKYERARIKASNAPVVVCTYYYWLIQKDLVRKCSAKKEDRIDAERNEFVICDECHNISSIVQDLYSISVGDEFIKHVNSVYTLFPDVFRKYTADRDILTLVSDIIASCSSAEYDMEHDNMDGYYLKMSQVCTALKMLKESVNTVLKELKGIGIAMKSDGKPLYELDSKFFRELSWFRNAHERLAMYIEGIANRSNNIITTINQEKTRVMLNSTDESYLMDEHLHSNYKVAVFMSATVGGFKHFTDELYMESEHDDSRDMQFTEMGSSFDFTNSPIFYTPDFSMSRKTYEQNLPYIARMIDNIMNVWVGRRGCIFTSSYKMVDDILPLLSPTNVSRLTFYKNTEEKAVALTKYRSTPDAVIIGPSLFEGISLDDEFCRFSIITKVPYADISNKLTNWKRIRYGQDEYNTSAIRDIIQAVGRGVRNENDWCYTYILDGSFGSIYASRDRFPDDFKRRFRLINSKILLQ